jgi:hypothetical protein
MDDETIPRRDAIAGLAVMGMLLMALVGTIGIRIAHPSRKSTGTPRRSAASIDQSVGGAAGLAAASLPTEPDFTPEAAIAGAAATVQQASHEQAEMAPPTPALRDALPAPPLNALPERRSEAFRFIAPKSP